MGGGTQKHKMPPDPPDSLHEEGAPLLTQRLPRGVVGRQSQRALQEVPLKQCLSQLAARFFCFACLALKSLLRGRGICCLVR